MMAMTSPLGDDVLIPIRLSAQEAISQPFQFDVVAVSQSGKIDPNSLLNNPACVVLQVAGTPVRYFHGIIRSVAAEGSIRSEGAIADFEVYQISLVPRLWFLSQTVDCRVYEEKSAGDIIQSMFTDAGLTDLSGPPSSSTRQYTIQYNESDLHFATRLMEEEGWYYFFQHAASAHTLVIANQNSAFQDISNATLYLVGGADDTTRLLDFNMSATTVRGKMTLQDYESVSPTTLLQSAQPTVLQTGGATARDEFRWPASVGYTNEFRHRPVRQCQRQYTGAVGRHRQPGEVGDGGGRGGGHALRRRQPVWRLGARGQVHCHQSARQPVRWKLFGAQRVASGLRRHLAEPAQHRVLFQPLRRLPFGHDLASADRHAAAAHEWRLYRVGNGSAELRRPRPSTCRAARRFIPTTWHG